MLAAGEDSNLSTLSDRLSERLWSLLGRLIPVLLQLPSCGQAHSLSVVHFSSPRLCFFGARVVTVMQGLVLQREAVVLAAVCSSVVMAVLVVQGSPCLACALLVMLPC